MAQGLAIRRRAHDHLGAYAAGRARPVVDDDLLSQLFAQFSDQQARRHVTTAAGGKRHDVAQRSLRIRCGGAQRYSGRCAKRRDRKSDTLDAPRAQQPPTARWCRSLVVKLPASHAPSPIAGHYHRMRCGAKAGEACAPAYSARVGIPRAASSIPPFPIK